MNSTRKENSEKLSICPYVSANIDETLQGIKENYISTLFILMLENSLVQIKPKATSDFWSEAQIRVWSDV